jgi:PAS domain S-box-containing protein/putative nucleotidyltransferase with HDIG domain
MKYSSQKKTNDSQPTDQLQSLLENIKLVAIMLDQHGVVTFCSQFFLELTGWQHNQIVGKNWFDEVLPVGEQETWKQVFYQAVLSGQIPAHFEHAIKTRNGDERLIAWNNTLLRGVNGEINGLASIGEDITERKWTEKLQAAMYRIGQTTSHSSSSEDLFKEVHTILGELMPVDNFFIALYDPQTDLISFPYWIDQFDPPPPSQKPERGLTEYVLNTGKALWATPEIFEELIASNKVELIGANSTDWLGVPLKIKARIIGVMCVQSYNRRNQYHIRDLHLLELISDQVALVIERQRALDQVKISEKRYHLLVETSMDAILLATMEGEIVDCNRSLCEISKYSYSELLQMNIKQLTPDDVAIQVADYVKKAQPGGMVIESRGRRKDGSVFPIEISMQLTNIDEKPALVAYIKDITHSQLAEEALRVSESKFRSLAQNMAAGVFIHRGDHFLYTNPVFQRITGYSESELLQMRDSLILPPENRNEINQRLAVMENEANQYDKNIEFRIANKLGEERWISLSMDQIMFENGPAVIGTAIDITERRRHDQELKTIVHVTSALRTAVSRSDILPIILNQMIELFNATGAAIVLSQEDGSTCIVQAAGKWQHLQGECIPTGKGVSGLVITTGKPYLSNRGAQDKVFYHRELLEDLIAVVGVPLFAQGQVIGAMSMGRTKAISEEDLRLLIAISDIAGSAIHRADLFDKTIEQTNLLIQSYDATIEGWARALELRDKETQGHTMRVTQMTLLLAEAMGLSQANLVHVRRGVILHDIGKMGVPDGILLKPGPLSQDETSIMRRHPEYAFEMLSSIEYLKPALQIPYCHHEHWDGSGYPRGLKGGEIPLAARIFAVVDVWDALTSDRPYRTAWTKKEALRFIKSQQGIQFDPQVVKVFITLQKNGKL